MDAKEALEIMCRRCKNFEMCQGTGCEPRKKLIELAERDTPKKATIIDYMTVHCRNCGFTMELVHKPKYCQNCGQAIDWSD